MLVAGGFGLTRRLAGGVKTVLVTGFGCPKLRLTVAGVAWNRRSVLGPVGFGKSIGDGFSLAVVNASSGVMVLPAKRSMPAKGATLL